MDFHFWVMEKSWKFNVEKEGHPAVGGALETHLLLLLNELHEYNVLPLYCVAL